MWLESRRLGPVFGSLEEYAFTNMNKCATTRPWQNCLLNLVAFRSPLRFWNRAGRHPREGLFNALTLLLWSREVRESKKLPEGRVGDFLRRCLNSSARDRTGLIEAYLKLWRRFR
jgi:hypothetical protein